MKTECQLDRLSRIAYPLPSKAGRMRLTDFDLLDPLAQRKGPHQVGVEKLDCDGVVVSLSMWKRGEGI